MFGYVNIAYDSVSDEDKKLYSAYYCGLCKAIGKKSQLSRIGLNNDLTFLAVMLSGITEQNPEVRSGVRCIMHGLKQHDEVMCDEVMEYAADMNILLVYFKLVDDAEDEGRIFHKIAGSAFGISAKKVQKRYPDAAEAVKLQLKRLSGLEKNGCCILDETADCFGKLLEAVFSPCFITDKNTRQILEWIGYNLGRWIYIADAYEDMEKDRKSKSYNPILLSDYESDEEMRKAVYDAMTYSLVNIANAYDLLNIYRNDTLIRNILYAGLPQKQDSIFNETEEKNGPVQGAGSQS